MGAHGWCSDDDVKLDLLLSHFYTAQSKQSQVFDGTISSMSEIMQANSSNPLAMAQKLKNQLTTYLQRHFSSVDVEVTVKNEEVAQAELLIKIGYSSDGKQKSALRALQPSGGIFQHVIRVLNEG